MIVIDIEGYDPNLSDLGDGSIRKDGWIACIGLFDGTDYVCVKNLNPTFNPKEAVWSDNRIYKWLASSEDKILHNAIYDMSWLICGYGFEVGGIIHDTMTRMALIDEYADLGLDDCCKYFRLPGKNANDTIEAWYETVKKGLGLKKGFWKDLDILWFNEECQKQMEKYNEQDCRATYALFMAQEKQMVRYMEPYKLECELFPLVMEMKKNGIRINEAERDRLLTEIQSSYDKQLVDLEQNYGITDKIIRSPKQMTVAMNLLGIHSPILTATGGESWSANALDLIDNPVVEKIQACKNYNALLTKYLGGSLVKTVVNGRIHCTFSPNKRDDGGTITGRFASSKPNLQNIPARNEKHGQKSYGDEMRSLFLPEEGCLLGAFDYSAIEYRLLAHFAKGPQAQWLKEQARAEVDFHTAAMNITGIPERQAMKTINYGIIYGMGIQKLYDTNIRAWNTLGEKNGMSGYDYACLAYRTYLEKLPVVKDTMNYMQGLAKRQGYLLSIGNRIHHKPKPYFMDGRWNDGIYKVTNYLIQGSAADILKKGLVDALKSGVLQVVRLHLTVHDENVISIPVTKEGVQAAVAFQECMNNAYHERLDVPMKAEGGVGPNWGYKHAEKEWEELKQKYA